MLNSAVVAESTKPGYGRFWSEFAPAFDEPFRSYVTNEFAKVTNRTGGK